MDEACYETLCREVESVAMLAGFLPGEPAQPRPTGTIPIENSRVWKSSYAIVVLSPIDEAAQSGLQKAWSCTGAWLDGWLSEHEAKGQQVDGYLLFALFGEPTEALNTIVRRLELDPTICRKHVLWPDRNGSWHSRLRTITTFALPETIGVASECRPPELPHVAELVLDSYCAKRDYKHAAEELIRTAEKAAQLQKMEGEPYDR